MINDALTFTPSLAYHLQSLRSNIILHTANSIKVVPKQREKVEYEREKLAGSGIKNTQTEQNLVSRDFDLVAIYIHKKARFNFKLSGKPMNCNVFGNKTSHFRQSFFAHVPPFLFSLGQPQLIELVVYCKSLSMLFKFICRLRNVSKI